MSMPRENPRPRTGRAVFKGAVYTLAAVFVAAMLAALALVMVRNLGGVAGLLHGIQTLRTWGFAAQFVLIAVLWLRWPALVAWLVRRGTLPEAARAPLLARRNRWMAVLFAFEVFLFVCTMPGAGR